MSTTNESWFIFQNDYLLLTERNNLPNASVLTELKHHFLRQHFLGDFNQTRCYCSEINPNVQLPIKIRPVSLRDAFEVLGREWYVVIVKAYSIINWDKNHQFCGRCGHITVHNLGTFERKCTICDLILHPRISPSMIVLIYKGDQILMARGSHFAKGKYGLIAGFIEVGESIEDAVYREVREEVGLEIKNLRYFGSQPWPFPDSLMIGFTAQYVSGEITIDQKEIEEANWYHYENLPSHPSSLTLARKLIDYFIAEKEIIKKV